MTTLDITVYTVTTDLERRRHENLCFYRVFEASGCNKNITDVTRTLGTNRESLAKPLNLPAEPRPKC